MLSLLLAFSLPISLQSCSNVLLPSSPHSSAIHARTMDLGSWVDFTFVAEPPATSATLGYIGVVPSARHLPVAIKKAVTAGINTNGLSCDMQTLINTQYPEKPTDKIGVLNGFFCEWVLRSYSNVNEVLEALALSHQVYGPDTFAFHFILRDSSGSSIVVEFLEGQTHVHADDIGVVTNEPPYPWHVQNAEHWAWKQTLALPDVTIPSGFYPDLRFLRLLSLKSGLPEAGSYKDVVQDAVHLLNSVTIPHGEQIATDSGQGEGSNDHTVFGLVYDHDPSGVVVYFRSYDNQSLQKISLKDLGLEEVGGKRKKLAVVNANAWFVDVAGAFK